MLIKEQKSIADLGFGFTQKNPQIIQIMEEAANNLTDQNRKDLLRGQLHKIVNPIYRSLKIAGVLHYQFFLPNNESFYRAHKPSRFGDGLTEIREDVRRVNQTQKPINGFVQGRTAHGFRSVFPLVGDNEQHMVQLRFRLIPIIFKRLLKRCDEALYLAKENGRNRVEVKV